MCTHTLSNMAGRTQTDGFLTQEDLNALLPDSHRVSYPTGTVVVREGDDSDFVLYIERGHLKAETGNPRAIVYIHGPGRLAGELAVMTSSRRTADLVAVSQVEALLISGHVWLEYLLANRRVNLAMLRHLAGRIVARDQQPESMTSSEHKIARGLLRLADSGMGDKVETGLRISGVTQRDLGSLCGLSRESAAAVLRRLREDKIITTGRGSLTIHDLEAIESLASRAVRPPLGA